jgi:Zn finger protein HypA/HybF involved in hydrogenase expression
MDREDVRTLADAGAKVAEALKPPQDTIVVIKKESRGKCPHCDGEISESDIFCPTCKNKVL